MSLLLCSGSPSNIMINLSGGRFCPRVNWTGKSQDKFCTRTEQILQTRAASPTIVFSLLVVHISPHIAQTRIQISVLGILLNESRFGLVFKTARERLSLNLACSLSSSSCTSTAAALTFFARLNSFLFDLFMKRKKKNNFDLEVGIHSSGCLQVLVLPFLSPGHEVVLLD